MQEFELPQPRFPRYAMLGMWLDLGVAMIIIGWRRKLLVWLLNDIIRQGPNHFTVTTELYELIRDRWARTFFENNAITHDQDLLVCFNRTLRLGEAKYRRF